MLERFQRFSLSISEISRYWHKIASEEMEKYNLKGPYATYITVLYRYPEGITAVKLCELCSKDKADVSRAIKELEKSGLILKSDSKAGSYRLPVKLSPEGISLARLVNEKAAKAVEIGGEGISDEERETFYRVLEIISSNLAELSKNGFPSK